MKIDKDYDLEKSTHGFVLIEKKMGERKKKSGDVLIVEKNKLHYFSTVYQALISYMKQRVEKSSSIEEIPIEVNKAMESIRLAEEEIKKSFRIEVFKVKP